MSRYQICVHTVILIDPCDFILLTEVIDSDEFLVLVFTDKGKDGRIPGIDRAQGSLGVKYTVAVADVL